MNRSFEIAVKGAAAALLLTATTLTGRVELKQQGNKIVPVKYPPPYSLLYVAAAGALSYSIYRDLNKTEVEEVAFSLPVQAASSIQTVPATVIQEPIQAIQPEYSTIQVDSVPITNPSQLETARQAVSKLLSNPKYQWITQLIDYPAALLWGGQGAGKSTFANFVVLLKLTYGHEVEIVDGHYKAGNWKGLKVVGKGQNYAEIGDRFAEFVEEIVADYQQYAEIEDYQGRKLCLLVEEMTNLSEKEECNKQAAKFVDTCLSDIRKVGKTAIFVAHDNILSAIGGGKGAKKRDGGMIQLQLIAKPGPNGKPIPAGYGILTVPGAEPVQVAIPNLKEIKDFTPYAPKREVESTKVEEVNADNPFSVVELERQLTASDVIAEKVREMRAQGLSNTKIAEAISGKRAGANKEFRTVLEIAKTV